MSRLTDGITRLTLAERAFFGIHQERAFWVGSCPRPDCPYRFEGGAIPGSGFSRRGHTTQGEVASAVAAHYAEAHL